MSEQFCLKWKNHMNNMMEIFKNLLSSELMTDVTLACDGMSLKAHKIVLSACSPFFQSLFLENPCKHPIVILKEIKYSELKAIIEFMYHGEVNVAQNQLTALMKTAETLRVKGLAEVTNEKKTASSAYESSHRTVQRTDTPPPKRKKNRRKRKKSKYDQNYHNAIEPKIKQPDSPEIDELKGNMDAHSSQYSNVPSLVPMQTVSVSSPNTDTFHKQSQQQQHQEQRIDQGADETVPLERSNLYKPSKLLEQTLTTDDLTRSSVQSNITRKLIQRQPGSSTDHSTALVPTTPLDCLVTNTQPDSQPEIYKPEDESKQIAHKYKFPPEGSFMHQVLYPQILRITNYEKNKEEQRKKSVVRKRVYSDTESIISVKNQLDSIPSVSPVNTSDLSSFDDMYSISSYERLGLKRQKVSLTEFKMMSKQGRVAEWCTKLKTCT